MSLNSRLENIKEEEKSDRGNWLLATPSSTPAWLNRYIESVKYEGGAVRRKRHPRCCPQPTLFEVLSAANGLKNVDLRRLLPALWRGLSCAPIRRLSGCMCTTQGPSWGYLKVNSSETLSFFGDEYPQNGSKNDQMVPRTTMGCPHEGPRVVQAPAPLVFGSTDEEFIQRNHSESLHGCEVTGLPRSHETHTPLGPP